MSDKRLAAIQALLNARAAITELPEHEEAYLLLNQVLQIVKEGEPK